MHKKDHKRSELKITTTVVMKLKRLCLHPLIGTKQTVTNSNLKLLTWKTTAVQVVWVSWGCECGGVFVCVMIKKSHLCLLEIMLLYCNFLPITFWRKTCRTLAPETRVHIPVSACEHMFKKQPLTVTWFKTLLTFSICNQDHNFPNRNQVLLVPQRKIQVYLNLEYFSVVEIWGNSH